MEERLEDVTSYLTLAIPNLEVKYIYQNTILAVSYTHLDVYKRQIQHSKIVFMSGKIGCWVKD